MACEPFRAVFQSSSFEVSWFSQRTPFFKLEFQMRKPTEKINRYEVVDFSKTLADNDPVVNASSPTEALKKVIGNQDEKYVPSKHEEMIMVQNLKTEKITWFKRNIKK